MQSSDCKSLYSGAVGLQIRLSGDPVAMTVINIIGIFLCAVKAIKEAILESRYRAARLVNKEVLALYYAIGGYISVQSRAARWESNHIMARPVAIR